MDQNDSGVAPFMGLGTIEDLTFVPSIDKYVTLPTDVVLSLPVSIRTAKALVRFYQDGLQVRVLSWQGGGWHNLVDALEDGVTWQQRRIVVLHAKLPRNLSSHDLDAYVSILAYFVAYRKFRCAPLEPDLVVVFPENSRQDLEVSLKRRR